MARMYPSEFPAEEAAERGRDAERLFYTLCAEQLPDRYAVLYGVRWLHKDGNGRAQQGEADFCLVDDERGVLVVEIKGGRVSRDGKTQEWVSVDRYGGRHLIKDPARQAERSMFALKDKLRSLPGWKQRPMLLGYAVGFPDGDLQPSTQLPANMPRDVVIMGTDLRWLDKKVDAILAYWDRPADGERMDIREVAQRVVALLSPQVEVVTTLGSQVAADSARILQLTREQMRAFDMLRGIRRVAVRGVAGSGKTIIALEQAKRLASEGFRTLLTCYNRRLADELQARTADRENLVCDTFHALCETIAKKAGIDLSGYGDGKAPSEYFDRTLPAALIEALSVLPDERFDAVVVDEGQDFQPDWLASLELLQTTSREGVFFLFYDETQGIFGRSFVLPQGMTPISLARNLRNSRTIHELATRVGGRAPGTCEGTEGRPVEFITAEDPQAVKHELSRLLHRLIRDEGVAPEDVAILTARTKSRSSLAGEERVGAFRIAPDVAPGDNAVLYETISRFKGLERPVVILIDVGAMLERQPTLGYVGITRATSHLVIIDSAAALARLGG